MKKLVSILLVATLAGCGATSKKSVLKNEQLLQTLPLPEGTWEVYQRKPSGNVLQTTWLMPSTKDLLQVFVVYGDGKADLQLVMDGDSKIGRKNCEVLFSSSVVSSNNVNSYPQLTWQSECKTQSGFYSMSMHKAIAGNDSLYMVKRIFKSKPSDVTWRLWSDYLGTISLCDSRRKSHPCPESLKEVKNSETQQQVLTNQKTSDN